MHTSRPVKTVGAYEAKTHLASLLNQVEASEEIVITSRERPVARLVPVEPIRANRDVFDRIRVLRGMITLGKNETPKDLINEGLRT